MMRTRLSSLYQGLLLGAAVLGFAFFTNGCDAVQQAEPEPAAARSTDQVPPGEALRAGRGYIVVANRSSGTVSVIDTRTDTVVRTLDLPGELPNAPMYVVYTAAQNRVFVGDRANNQVIAFDAYDGTIEGTVPATGIFHMWADGLSQQLWVVDDVNDAITVIDPTRLEVITTVPVAGGRPHDVVLDTRGRFAFVSVIDSDGVDHVVKYSTRTFAEVGRVEAGEDPHLAYSWQENKLFVPSQGSDTVFIFNADDLSLIDQLDVPGAHGAGMARNGKAFYTSNLPGEGTNGLCAISTEHNEILGLTDTPFPVPHNIAVTRQQDKLYVTHSTHSAGTQFTVTVYSVSEANPVPTYLTTINVGLNPFGLAYVP